MNRFFQLNEHSTTVAQEVRAGLTTFMAMAYIIFANPAILSAAHVPFKGAVIATCAAAGIMSIIMGLVTNYPLCLAAGMGLNAVVAFTIVLGLKVPWQTAMGVVVLEGLVILLLSATPLRRSVMDAVPLALKQAIAAGIGLFITFIGMQSAHLIQPHPATLVTFGNPAHPAALLSLVSLGITAFLMARGVRGALLLGIAASVILGMLPIWHLPDDVLAPDAAVRAARWGSLVPIPTTVVEVPSDFSTFFAFDLAAALTWKLLPIAFVLLMTDFFDTMGSAIAVGSQAGFLTPDGRIPKTRRLLVVDSLGAVLGGMFGCSSNTCYIESQAGVAEGGRTGLTAVVCGLAFLAAMFFVPVVALVAGGVRIATGTGPHDFVVRHPTTAAALIIVGFYMMSSVRSIDWTDVSEGLPAFLILALIPLTFSITHGIGAGFIAYVFLKVCGGRAREISPFLWAVSALFVLHFALAATA